MNELVTSSCGIDAEGPQRAVRDPVQDGDRRVQDAHDQRHRRREQQHRAVRAGERDVLGHHLAEHDVQVADDAQRDRERDRVHEALGHADRLERAFEEVRDRGLAEIAEAERADRDAQLRAGHHQRHVLHRLQRRAGGAAALGGARLDRAAAGGDQRELGADEERVERQQDDGDADGETGAHASSSSSSVSISIGTETSRTWSTRRSSSATTVSVTFERRAVVVVDLERHAVVDGGHAGEVVADQAADRLVVVVLGQAQPGDLAHLVRPHQAGEHPAAVGFAARALLALVVLVADLADDLLHEVLERHEPVDVAELVHDERHLQAAGAELVEQVVELQAGGHEHRLVHHLGDLHVAAALERHRDGVLDVHDPGDRPVFAQHGEAGAPALPRGLGDRGDRVVLGDGHDPPARGHDLVRGALAERE